MSTSKLDRIKELTGILKEAAEAYYAKDAEIMSNLEYDKLYDELVQLEEETGIILAGSPTQTVGYAAVDELPKEAHDRPMLSLAKTKVREELQDWLMDKEGLLSWKLDGLTIVLTYEEGKLTKAVTRGNGEVGEVITANAKCFQNVPLSVPHKGKLVLRGEAVISYSDFEKINASIEDETLKYKNPRNLCSGSVRQLNSAVTAERCVHFYAFTLVQCDGMEFSTREEQIQFLQRMGFATVPYVKVDRDRILDAIEDFAERVENYDIPSDGLVLVLNDIAYGESLGRTSKFPRDSIAFKWADELKETTLLEIEWSASRTGLINPVAIFEPVELEGTTVSRASVHNISIVRALKLGLGDRVTVYKANMIIPQIAENLDQTDTLEIPCNCPVCGGATEVRQINEGQFLYCTNASCTAKKIKLFALFVGRDGLNIDGMSEATLEKFIAKGFLHEFSDLYHLDRHKDEIISMEGFGQKSYDKLIQAIEVSRKTNLPKVLYGLGIAGVGLATAKLICKHFQYDFAAMEQAGVEELSEIEGIGEVIAQAFVKYFASEENRAMVDRLLAELDMQIEKVDATSQTLAGQVIVITGSLELYENRNALKDAIEAKGGKVTGSVTAKTNYLINNDIASTSSKNKKAKELGVPIITEKEFAEQFL
ncbi:MAG: NAD-dependent DNA ligase LigA [Lachnospiraceae bacterium]|nr:NAD-dependent DNA ligase LigA [Lachnospiraceae bacterium]